MKEKDYTRAVGGLRDAIDATYACVNYGEAYAHPDIRDRSILIDADIDRVLGDLLGGQNG